MATHRTRKTPSIARQAAELAVAVPPVIAHRLTRLALAGPAPSARDRKEFQRMGAEKAAAFAESWNAMAQQALETTPTLALSFLRAFWSPARAGTAATRQVSRAALGMVQKGLAPVHRRAVANAKRLGRTKLK
jgi:aryl-alcohol dehydrogenase-like predicted oxidoreductase